MTPPLAGARVEVAGGIARVVFDMPGKVNVMNDLFIADMEALLDWLEASRTGLRGVVLTSAKPVFFAGGDLALMGKARPGAEAFLQAHFTRLKAPFRRLERLGRPVVAALNGSALGGGYELALACHHRVALDVPGLVVALPEVGFGILPGAGGVVRLTRMVGLARALDVLLTGRRVGAAEALARGLVDELAATPDALLARAEAWIDAHPDAAQNWEAPPGVTDPVRVASVAGLQARAAASIAALAQASLGQDMDEALLRETEGLVALLVSPEAAELIGRFFAARRPASPQAA